MAKESAGETLLLVEDEPSIRDLMARRLTRKGYTVLTAPNGRDAIRLAERHEGRIDLLITDVVMPHMDGFALERELAGRFPSLKVIFMTGYADHAVAVRGGLEASGRPYLLKPFVPEDLEEAISRELRTPRTPQRDTGPDAAVPGDKPTLEPRPDWRKRR